MTVSRTNSSTRAVANGTATSFNYSFVCFSAGDMQVLNGAEIINPSLYTVNIASDYLGGSVEFDTAPAANSIITMQRDMTLDQQTSYPVAGAFQPQTHERALDKLTLLVQQVADSIEGARIATNWLGQWTTATAYAAKDLIYAPTYVTAGLYYCLESHTSGDLAADLAAGKWTRILDLTTIVSGEPSLGLPVAAGDALTSAADGTRAWVAKESSLGNPAQDGLALVSTAAGVRSWNPVGSIIPRIKGLDAGYPFKLLSWSPLTITDGLSDYVFFHNTEISLSSGSSLFGTDLLSGVDLIIDSLTATGIIPTTANIHHYHFVVRLVADGSTTVKSYTTMAAPLSDSLIDACVFICATKNKATGGSSDAWYKNGQVFYTSDSEMPVVCATTTTSDTSYSLADLIPSNGVSEVELLITGTGAGTITINVDILAGMTYVLAVANGSKTKLSIPLRYGYLNIKHTTAGGSVKISGYKLARG